MKKAVTEQGMTWRPSRGGRPRRGDSLEGGASVVGPRSLPSTLMDHPATTMSSRKLTPAAFQSLVQAAEEPPDDPPQVRSVRGMKQESPDPSVAPG